MERLTTELKLDDAQKAQVQKLMDEQREREKQLRTSVNYPQDLIDRIKQTREELRQATEANDQERMKQLREQLMTFQRERDELQKPIQAQVEQSQEQLHDQILGVLRDDQKAGFEQIWDESMTSPQAYGGSLRNPRMLKMQVDKLKDLTPTQKQQIDTLFEEFRKSTRGEPQPGALKGRKDQIKKLFDDVTALLTPEQKEKVEKALQGPPAGQRGQDGRPAHPRRPAPPGQPGQPEQPGAEGQPQPQGGEQPGQAGQPGQ